jgi:hypothetical protein
MAFGIKQKFLRFLPKKKHPPINLIVRDSYGPAELAQTATILAFLETQLNPQLSHINANLVRVNDNLVAISAVITNLNAAILSLTSIKNQQNLILASAVSNQIATNNFFKLVNAEQAVLDKIDIQLKEAIKLGIELDQLTRVTSAATSFINSSVDAVAETLKQTLVYQTVEGYLKDIKASIISVLPNSPTTIKSISQAAAGIKATGI